MERVEDLCTPRLVLAPRQPRRVLRRVRRRVRVLEVPPAARGSRSVDEEIELMVPEERVDAVGNRVVSSRTKESTARASGPRSM